MDQPDRSGEALDQASPGADRDGRSTAAATQDARPPTSAAGGDADGRDEVGGTRLDAGHDRANADRPRDELGGLDRGGHGDGDSEDDGGGGVHGRGEDSRGEDIGDEDIGGGDVGGEDIGAEDIGGEDIGSEVEDGGAEFERDESEGEREAGPTFGGADAAALAPSHDSGDSIPPDPVTQFFAKERTASATPVPETPPLERQRCGFVALIGAPNAGKSTLVNALVGAKVSIVTHKVQTTRAIVRGIVLAGDAQVVLVDTPGIFAPRRRLDRAMVRTAWSNAHDADRVCLLIDARRGIDDANAKILEQLTAVRLPKALLLTKIDLVEPPVLLALIKAANEVVSFGDTFMLSAKTGDGVDELRRHLAAAVAPGPWLYPADQISDLPERQLAAEITREQLTLRLHDELPYSATVETETWKTLRNGSVRIEQAIFIEREGQKKIVLGEKGRTIRAISMAARSEIAKMTGAPVHLFLFVKVRPRWTDDPERYREMGLDFSR